MQNTLALNQVFPIKSLSLKISLRFFWAGTITLLLSLLVFYIFQANEVVKGTYSIKQYEKSFAQASLENNNLKINFSKSNSLDSIEVLAQNLNFEKNTGAKYIQMSGGQVAINPVRN